MKSNPKPNPVQYKLPNTVGKNRSYLLWVFKSRALHVATHYGQLLPSFFFFLGQPRVFVYVLFFLECRDLFTWSVIYDEHGTDYSKYFCYKKTPSIILLNFIQITKKLEVQSVSVFQLLSVHLTHCPCTTPALCHEPKGLIFWGYEYEYFHLCRPL